MVLLSIDHVQLAMPLGGEAAARAFYAGLLDLIEVPKPAELAGRGGCWFERDGLRVHLGVDPDFHPARKAHPAFAVDDLAALRARLAGTVHATMDETPQPGQIRAFVADPFGNRIELIEHRER